MSIRRNPPPFSCQVMAQAPTMARAFACVLKRLITCPASVAIKSTNHWRRTRRFTLGMILYSWLGRPSGVISLGVDANLETNQHFFAFSSQNFPNRYLGGVSCAWNIVAPLGHQLIVSVDQMDLGGKKGSCGASHTTVTGK